MTHERDIERLLDHWFADGPTEAPDRVIDTVADRIGRQRQRPGWRLDWRQIRMTTPFKLATAVVAVVFITVLGYNLLPGNPGVGGPGPTASPTTTPTLVPSASPPALSLSSGPLAAGAYRSQPFGFPSALTVTFTVPDGWQGFPDWALIGPSGTGAPDGIGIGFLMADGLFSDPCHWDVVGGGVLPQAGDIAVGPTVDDLVAALRAQTAYTTTEPTDVTIGGYSGKQLVLQVPFDVDISTCDNAAGATEGAYFVWGSSTENDLFAQGPGNRWTLRILDVAGSRVIIVVNDFAGTHVLDQAAAQAIVDSIGFTP